ncbi:MAG: hypothetical protein IJ642_10665 [Oscillospiraceae bacterium]|nr:hypothetical protein [Oscillospiraceae bacterium]
MTITVNLNEKSTEYVQSSIDVNGVTIDELINTLIAERIQNEPEEKDTYERKWERIMQAIDGFTEDCFENFENERLNELPQERESL